MKNKHAELKYREAVDVLNNNLSKLTLAPSDVHGIGVFATRDIKRGERLFADEMPHMFDLPYKYFKKLNKDLATSLLGHFPHILNKSHFFYPIIVWTIYMNHSDKPNYNNKTDKAKRLIKKGEEVFEDYRKIEGWEKIFKWLDN